MKKDLERFGDKLTPEEERRIWTKMKGSLRGEKSRRSAWRPRLWLTTATVAAAAALVVVAIWQADLLRPDKVTKGKAPRDMSAVAPPAEAPSEAGRPGEAPSGNAASEAPAVRARAGEAPSGTAPSGEAGAASGEAADERAKPAERVGPPVAESQKPAGYEAETAPEPEDASRGVMAVVPEDKRVYEETPEGEAPQGAQARAAEAGEAGALDKARAQAGAVTGEAAPPAEARRETGAESVAPKEERATAPAAAAEESVRSKRTGYGEIRGRVVDASGAPLPYANVLVVGTRYGASADDNGYFVIEMLPPGTYTLIVSYMGYETLVIPDVFVERDESNDLMALSLKRTVVGRADTLLVAEEAEAIDLKRSDTRASADRLGKPEAQTPMQPGKSYMGSDRAGETKRLTDETKAQQGEPYGAREKDRARPYKPARPPYPSLTGGRRPVNDELADDMYFRHYGANPFIEADEDALSTFALDVDTGSYTICRRYITEGHLPPPEAVRVEEFVNFFKKNYDPPRHDDFSIRVDGMPSPFAHVKDGRYRLLRIGIRGRVIDWRDRLPAQVVLVIDTSGSMDMGNRLPLLKESLNMLLDELRPDDEIGVVEFGTRARVVLPLRPVYEGRDVRRAIDRLRAGGSTNAEGGLRLGYDMMRRYERRGWIHRIIFCSDGVANVGNTGWESILENVRRDSDDIMLSTIGFGMGNYNDILMERLADAGDGQYSYVDDLREAKRVLRENITGTLQTIARDAKAQIEFDPRYVDKYRLLGYENRDVRDEDFRNDYVDAGDIGAGHEVTVLYEVELKPEARRAHVATVRLRYEPPDGGRAIELEKRVTSGDFAREVGDAPADLVVDACVAEFAEILRGSYWAKDGSLEDVLDLLRDAERRTRPAPEVRELEDLIRKAASLKGDYDERRRGERYEDRGIDRDE